MLKYSNCTVIIDADTILFKAAKMLQEDYIIVTHKVKKKWSKEFKNVTTFYGRKKDRSGGWIGQMNSKRDEDKQISVSDFLIEHKYRIVSPDNYGFSDVKKKISAIMEATACNDYKLAIGGDSNFRYDLAQIQPYKGERKEKPERLPYIVDWVKERYGENVLIADNEEADDILAQYALRDFNHHRETGEHRYVLSYIDKDIDMCIAL